MKNLVTFCILFCLNFFSAQNKQIIFEIGTLDNVLTKAEKNNKPIFIDAYTSWCGPCKKMAKEIFTKDTVANFYNQTFVNYKLDMEKGEGIEFAKKYQINCYPNFLILDAKGNVIHRTAGFMDSKSFIEFAQNAFTPTKNFIALKANYEKNGVTEKTIADYIFLMESACLTSPETITNYLQTVKDEDLSNETNWKLIRDNVIDLNSREINYFIKNYKTFELKYGTAVEDKFIKLGLQYFSTFLQTKKLDSLDFEKSKKEFLKLTWPYSSRVIFETELRLNEKFNISSYYLLASKSDFLKFNYENAEALNSMAWRFYEEVTDKKQLEAALLMSKRSTEIHSMYMYLDTYAALLYKTVNYKEAEIQAKKAIEAAKQEKLKEEDYKSTTSLLLKINEKLKD